jgi:hypothetical protein
MTRREGMEVGNLPPKNAQNLLPKLISLRLELLASNRQVTTSKRITPRMQPTINSSIWLRRIRTGAFTRSHTPLIALDRLEVAEQQLALASSDNARLRELQLRDPDHQRSGSSDELSSQVRDLKWKLQQLQTQYDHVSSKSSAQLEGLKTAEDQLEVRLHKIDPSTIDSLDRIKINVSES